MSSNCQPMPVKSRNKVQNLLQSNEKSYKLLISQGIPFWNRKYPTNCTESGDNTIIVVTWTMLKSYFAEKNPWTNGVNPWTPGQCKTLYCSGNTWMIGMYAILKIGVASFLHFRNTFALDFIR